MMIYPTPTIAIAVSCGIPKSEHAMGMRSSDPPAIPDVPHAAKVARNESTIADATSTLTPTVFAAVIVIMVMTTAAPSMLIVDPNGMDTESGYSGNKCGKKIQNDNKGEPSVEAFVSLSQRSDHKNENKDRRHRF